MYLVGGEMIWRTQDGTYLRPNTVLTAEKEETLVQYTWLNEASHPFTGWSWQFTWTIAKILGSTIRFNPKWVREALVVKSLKETP